MNGAGGDDLSQFFPDPSFLMEIGEIESDNNGDHGDHQNGRKRRKMHRHTPQQIQELENFFKECPHPDTSQCLNLAQRLNMEHKQVKYWFQNRRTHAKTKHERDQNLTLRQEHFRLRGVQDRLREAMKLSACSSCGHPSISAEVDFDKQRLIAENTKLNQEIDQLFGLATNPPQIPPPPVNAPPPELHHSGGENPMMRTQMLLDIATGAMNELVTLGEESNNPFWIMDSISRRETLNYEMYTSIFNNGIMNPEYVMEATKESGYVLMTSLAIVDILMDVNKWADVFAPIVSEASQNEVLLTGSSQSKSGSLQLTEAEFQVISPLVPRRQVKFLRYCKELKAGLWIVVDVTPSRQNPDWLANDGSRRLPSGIIIEDITSFYSKVTWIEQAEYGEKNQNQIRKSLIGSGIGLSAKRWLTTLQRHGESIPTLSSNNFTRLYPGLSPMVATEMVKLAKRMTRSFYSCITGSSVYAWERIPVPDVLQHMRLMTRKNVNEQAGEQTGIVLSATTSAWFPVSQRTLFYYLSNPSFRNQWDVLTFNTSIEDQIKIEKTKHHGNYISLSKIIGTGMLVLQEVWNDESGALVVYAPVENGSIEEVLRAANSDSVKLLPSGFSILPDGESMPDRACLMTVAFQILVSSEPAAELTQDLVEHVQELMDRTIRNIKFALHIPA